MRQRRGVHARLAPPIRPRLSARRLPMPALRHLPLVLLLGLLLGGALAAPAAAQRIRYGQDRPEPTQALTARYTYLDFRYNGEASIPVTFDYAGPVYGVAFSRPSFYASVAYGRGDPAPTAGDPTTLQLIDADLFTWAEVIRLLTVDDGRGRLYVPLALHSDYRRVSRSNEDEEEGFTDAFSVTVLGLGTGLVGDLALSRRVHLAGRALPVIGLATRTLGDATGNARLFDADVTLHVAALAGGLGLTAGYAFRVQDWNVGLTGPVTDFADDFFHYGGHQHTLRLGVNW